MIDNDLDLLVGFRSEVPLPDEETAERIYRRVTTTRPRWRVLLPARFSRRTRVFLAVGLAGLVLVPAAVAFSSKIADMFEGTPAPPEVSTNFTAFNTMADLSTKQGFAKNAPHANVSKVHGVIEIQTADGPEDLWAAPSDDGGTCYFIDFANDPPGPTGKLGFGGCNPSGPPASNINWSADWMVSHPAADVLRERLRRRSHGKAHARRWINRDPSGRRRVLPRRPRQGRKGHTDHRLRHGGQAGSTVGFPPS